MWDLVTPCMEHKISKSDTTPRSERRLYLVAPLGVRAALRETYMRDTVMPAHPLQPSRRQDYRCIVVRSVQFVKSCVQVSSLYNIVKKYTFNTFGIIR